MKNKKFDVVYSLGFGCGMASSLKRLGLRMTSGPFDWIVGPCFEYRVELILNNFKDFFNKEDLVLFDDTNKEFRPEDSNRRTDVYENKKTGFRYPHDFMEGDDFEATYPIVLDKYNRRIERFYEYLKDTNKRVLLTYLSFSVLDDKIIYDCYKKLIEKFGNHISLLIFNHKPNLDYNTIEKRYLDENLIVYDLNTVLYDEEGKLVVRSNRALIIPCLKKYKLDMTLRQILTHISVKTLVKLSPLFIWDKKKRFEFREKYKNRV